MISLEEEIRKDKQYLSRRWNKRGQPARKRHQDLPNRKNYHPKRRDEQRQNHQQIKHCLKISNLHYAITKQQLQTIFSQFGKLKTCRIDWDKMGRSKETAIIEYFEKGDQQIAINQLDGKELQGQMIKLEAISQAGNYPHKRHEISKHSRYRVNRSNRNALE